MERFSKYHQEVSSNFDAICAFHFKNVIFCLEIYFAKADLLLRELWFVSPQEAVVNGTYLGMQHVSRGGVIINTASSTGNTDMFKWTLTLTIKSSSFRRMFDLQSNFIR